MKKMMAFLMVLALASPAWADGTWDGLRVTQGVRYETGPDHPPFDKKQAVIVTCLLGEWMQALTAGTVVAAGMQEYAAMGWVSVAMVVGSIREIQTNPAKYGKFRYNGQMVAGESAKWRRSATDIGWNELAPYSTDGPGRSKWEPQTPFDRIGS